MGLAGEQPVAAIGGLQRTQKRPKKGLKMTHFMLYQKLTTNNHIFSSKPQNIQEYSLS